MPVIGEMRPRHESQPRTLETTVKTGASLDAKTDLRCMDARMPQCLAKQHPKVQLLTVQRVKGLGNLEKQALGSLRA